MSIEGAQLVLRQVPFHLGPLDGPVVCPLAGPYHVNKFVAVDSKVDSLAHSDVREGRPLYLQMYDGIKERRELVHHEVIVLRELVGIRLGEDGAVYVVLAGAEGGEQGRAFGDNDDFYLV